MNTPNQQIPPIIYQTQCAYLYWYVFLNLLAMNDIFLCWDGKQAQLFQWDGKGFVLLQIIDSNDVEPSNQENAKWSWGNDKQPITNEVLKKLPLSDIIQDHKDLNPLKKRIQDIKPPQKDVGDFH